MKQHIAHITLVVDDYDKAIRFYTEKLDFDLVEDTFVSEEKRWVLVAPPGQSGCNLLLAKAATAGQFDRICNQTGGRVALFLYTDDFWRDYKSMRAKGVKFIREPLTELYGTVAVFEDLSGDFWDLLEPSV